ncbi:hypothetical protein EJ08DRAFT_701183 [Tothia fuscella]|uniref:HECT-type E3 ubiquitin transferase n=1 Tax=Tothia fuscella TaxID=1048955 RepID=A0A9P4NJB5_9PEZI|nr:hypothetical protein EJ08DRAFT_701183 [Tothia fuscella]
MSLNRNGGTSSPQPGPNGALPSHSNGSAKEEKTSDTKRNMGNSESTLKGQEERYKEFERLTRHYIIQIHYGCTNPHCTTPTCFSCHQRLTNAPVRRPTLLTARTLASLLASEEDPHAGLCPHGFYPHDLEGFAQVPEEELVSVVLKPQKAPEIRMEQNGKVVAGITAKSSQTTQAAIVRKDRRSLTQNLFDTRAAKSVGWKSPVEALQGLSQNASSLGMPVDTPESGFRASKEQTRSTATIGSMAREQGALTAHRLANGNIKISVTSSSQRPSATEHVDTLNSIPATAVPQRFLWGTRPFWDKPLSKVDMVALRQIMSDNAHPHNNKNLTIDAHYDILLLHGLEGQRHSSEVQSRVQEITDVVENIHDGQFVRKTIEYHFRNPSNLLRCFRTEPSDLDVKAVEAAISPLQLFINGINGTPLSQTVPHIATKSDSFCFWKPFVGPLILDSIWHALGALFTPPPSIVMAKSPRMKPQVSSPQAILHPYVSDLDAAHIIVITIYALIGSVSALPVPKTQKAARDLRAWGRTLANSRQSGAPDELSDPWLQISDGLEYEPAVRLASRLVRAIAARRSFWLIERAMKGGSSGGAGENFPVIEVVLAVLKKEVNIQRAMVGEENIPKDIPIKEGPLFLFIEFIRTVMIKTWDGKTQVKRWEGFGAALEIMNDLYVRREELHIGDDAFYLPFLSEHIKEDDVTSAFTSPVPPNNNTLSLFSFPFLFLPSVLVRYFRILNFSKMSEAYSSASYHRHLINKLIFATDPGRFEDEAPLGNRRWNRHAFLEERLKPALKRYLVLDVRRDHLLQDTFDQLWGREKRELLRPLKVRMGMDEGGEEGVDHGGVSQEFFRVVFEKAFHPDAGLFVTDEKTRMSWFQPLSLEPLVTYELLGLLVGLAIYNGVTLPVTFPLVLYQKLLAKPHEEVRVWIEDGWPDLAKGFGDLLNWTEGDVADVFVREYAFDFVANGQRYAVDMLANGQSGDWPPTIPTSSATTVEIPLVTNANREEYVKDYIYYLTHKSVAPQFAAFARGFHTCLSPTALSLLSPPFLRSLSEGLTSHITLSGLKSCAKYEDGYTPHHPYIRDFWSIVQDYDDHKKRRLLEFVTASDRVPVLGWRAVAFCVVRNGGDTDRLPSSMTCFGKLLLPEYADKEKFRAKLDVALENSKGFGSM